MYYFSVLPSLCFQDDAIEIMKMTEHGIYEEPSENTHGAEENHYENPIADEKFTNEKLWNTFCNKLAVPVKTVF